MRNPARLVELPDPRDVALVAFDLDDTLAASKSPLSAEMAQTMADLLNRRPVCIISGGRFEQFDTQVLAKLPQRANLTQLHLMPTCGTRYLRYHGDDKARSGWHEVYFHQLSPTQKRAAISALETQAKRLGLWEPDDVVTGARIEDRGSQITFSALGQQASVADKKSWDQDGSKRAALRAAVAPLLADLEVRAGGSTSVDITAQGIDKAYGMTRLSEQTGLGLDQMLFIGDRLEAGGNDRPVLELGVACHAVSSPQETLAYLLQLIPTLEEPGDE